MATYNRLLDCIVTRINMSLPFTSSLTYIGVVLDIDNLETLSINSYEQLCIHYCHQKLLQFFSKKRIATYDLTLKKTKGVVQERIEYFDKLDGVDINQNTIFTLNKNYELSKVDRSTLFEYSKGQRNYSSHFRIPLPEESSFEHEELSDEELEIGDYDYGETIICATEMNELKKQLEEEIHLVESDNQMTDAENDNIYKELLKTSEELLKTLNALTKRDNNSEEQENVQLGKQILELEDQKSQLLQENENKQSKAEIETDDSQREGAAEIMGNQRWSKITNRKKISKQDESTQEKRDNEIAYRLSQEFGVTIDESVKTEMKRSDFVVKHLKSKKYDVTGWKYDTIRHAINTTTDRELLEACREEFLRRLKVYQAWKFRHNTLAKTEIENIKPKSLDSDQQNHEQSMTSQKSTVPSQRYFRVPFTEEGQNKGFWFAHFSEQNIARQMEIHDKINLLIAGRDDSEMCQLKLSETGLTRKRGAEILEYEFEREWKKNGGAPYIRSVEKH